MLARLQGKLAGGLLRTFKGWKPSRCWHPSHVPSSASAVSYLWFITLSFFKQSLHFYSLLYSTVYFSFLERFCVELYLRRSLFFSIEFNASWIPFYLNGESNSKVCSQYLSCLHYLFFSTKWREFNYFKTNFVTSVNVTKHK